MENSSSLECIWGDYLSYLLRILRIDPMSLVNLQMVNKKTRSCVLAFLEDTQKDVFHWLEWLQNINFMFEKISPHSDLLHAWTIKPDFANDYTHPQVSEIQDSVRGKRYMKNCPRAWQILKYHINDIHVRLLHKILFKPITFHIGQKKFQSLLYPRFMIEKFGDAFDYLVSVLTIDADSSSDRGSLDFSIGPLQTALRPLYKRDVGLTRVDYIFKILPLRHESWFVMAEQCIGRRVWQPFHADYLLADEDSPKNYSCINGRNYVERLPNFLEVDEQHYVQGPGDPSQLWVTPRHLVRVREYFEPEIPSPKAFHPFHYEETYSKQLNGKPEVYLDTYDPTTNRLYLAHSSWKGVAPFVFRYVDPIEFKVGWDRVIEPGFPCVTKLQDEVQ